MAAADAGAPSEAGVAGRARALRPWAGLTLRTVQWGLVALNGIVWVLCAWMLWHSRQLAIGDSEAGAVSSARLLEQAARATLDQSSITLNGMARQFEHQQTGHGFDARWLWPTVDAATAQLPEVERIGFFDARGRQLCGIPADRCQHIDISDRDYFALLREHPDRPPTLFGPYLSRTQGKPSLIMARALRTDQQGFAGVVLAVLPLSGLQHMVAAAQLGAHGAASLRTSDMQVLVRASAVPVLAPAAASSAPMVSERLRQEVARFPEAGMYHAVAPADGVERVTAYRKLPDHPIYALVGVATEDFLTGWWGMVQRTGGFLLLLTGASLLIERMTRAHLREQDRAQRLYDEAPCGYHSLDAQGRYLSINATELAWLGCSRSEVVGKLSPTDFFTDAGKATFAIEFPTLQHTGHLDELSLELVGRHGQRRQVLVTATVVRDANGRFVSSNSVMHDISALHQAQQASLATAHVQALMLDTDLVGMARVSARTLLWANRGMASIFGYEAEEWQGMPARTLYGSDEDYEHVGQVAYALLRAGKPFHAEMPLRRKDGSMCWAAVGVAPLIPEQDEVMLLVQDISAHKAAEAANLREVELRAQNEQLAETGRIKDEFLANMSHELRTPLNAVIGFSQLLQHSALASTSAKQATYIQHVMDSGQHLLGLVQTMLDFAKSASDRMAFNVSPLSVRAVLGEVAEIVQSRVQAVGLRLEVAVEPGLDTVVNDPLRLRQMVLHLVENAIKFSPLGGSVRLSARAVDESRWCVDVQDQGIGIDEGDLQKIFEPFVQLSAGNTRSYGGTGMGLALVQKIAHAQGGQVRVRSHVGSGSTFTLELPRQVAAWPEPVRH